MLRCFLLFNVVLSISLFENSIAIADEPTPITIMNVRGRPARELATVAADVIDSEKVELAVDSATNLLIIKGPEDDVKRVSRLLQTLDPLPPTVTLQVDISVTDPEQRGKSVIQDNLTLSMLDQTKGLVQTGQQTPVVTGTQSFGSRGTVNRSETIETGMILKAVPRVSGSGIILELEIEKSWLELPPPSDTEDNSAPAGKYSVYTYIVQTTLRLEAGKPSEISASVSGGTGSRQAVIKVSATVDGENKNTDTVRSERQKAVRPTPVRERPATDERRETSERTAPRSSGPNPQTLFDRLDADGDGQISGEEREGVMGRFLERLGFDSDGQITVEGIGEKMRQLRKERDEASGE